MSWEYLKAVTVRAVKTFAQTMASMITVGATFQQLDFWNILNVSVVAGVYSILTSLAGIPEVKNQPEDKENQ